MALAAAALAIIGGSLLTMGHLRSREADFAQAELAKLEAMSAEWEMRLASLRGAFRDQIWRQDLAVPLESPDDWAGWRVGEKLQAVEDTWNDAYGHLRGLAMVRSNGRVHAAHGDTTGLDAALAGFREEIDSDLLVSKNKTSFAGYVAVRFRPPATEQVHDPAELILLAERASVLPVPSTAPTSWILMNGPRSPLYASAASFESPFQKATWNILLSEDAGVVPHGDNATFGFSRLQVPGMYPMLLITEIRVPSGMANAAGAMVLLAGGALLLALVLSPMSRRRKTADALSDPPEVLPNGGETVTFRQIFQAVRQPLCVVDSQGRLMRVNASGRMLLRVQKGGKPEPAIQVTTAENKLAIQEFLSKVAEDPAAFPEDISLSAGDDCYFRGRIETARLYADKDGRGPVMIDFLEHEAIDEKLFDPNDTNDADTRIIADDYNPDPVILVGQDGIIRDYNEAAVDTCAAIKDTPLLSDVLPGIEKRDLPELLAAESEQRFDSLFGSQSFAFRAIPSPDGILLYGQKTSDARQLKIALEQAQEAFNSICALTPAAVLLIDPWNHNIQTANTAAAALFNLPNYELQGRCIDEFMEITWDEPAAQRDIVMTRPDGASMMCRLDHDLIKIEGDPVVLAVMTSLDMQDTPAGDPRALADTAESMADALHETVTEPRLPLGPGLLIVNNPTVREVTRRLLDKTGHGCESFSTLDDATSWIFAHELRPELVALDLGDFDDAADWLETVRQRCGSVPCLALSDGNDCELPTGGRNQYLEKPFELESLQEALMELDLEAEPATSEAADQA